MTQTATATHRYIGITDEQTVCDRCGKSELGRTVILVTLDADGNDDGVVRFGTTCASRALAVKGGARKVADLANFATYQTQQDASRARRWFAKWDVADMDTTDIEAVKVFARTYRRAQFEALNGRGVLEVGPGGVTLDRWVEILIDTIGRYRRAIADAALIAS
jgi:hypothetical protein